MNSSNETDRRQFSRVLFDAAAQLAVGDRRTDAKLLDISLKGALVRLPPDTQWPDADDTRLTVRLDDEGHSIIMHGRVAHREDDRLGFLCQHIDMDSITHLRRLVELNLGDPALLERELEALG